MRQEAAIVPYHMIPSIFQKMQLHWLPLSSWGTTRSRSTSPERHGTIPSSNRTLVHACLRFFACDPHELYEYMLCRKRCSSITLYLAAFASYGIYKDCKLYSIMETSLSPSPSPGSSSYFSLHAQERERACILNT
jgi:hypothetical protein